MGLESEYGFDLDEQQRIDNEQYQSNKKSNKDVINDENTPPTNVHKVH